MGEVHVSTSLTYAPVGAFWGGAGGQSPLLGPSPPSEPIATATGDGDIVSFVHLVATREVFTRLTTIQTFTLHS